MATRHRTVIAITAVALLGSLGLASGASASDHSLKSASLKNARAYGAAAKQQGKEFSKWYKARFSKKTSAAVLRALAGGERLVARDTKAIEAQEPSTPVGVEAKRERLATNTSYSRYLEALKRAVPLAMKGRFGSAKKEQKLALGYAAQGARHAKAAKRLFKRIK